MDTAGNETAGGPEQPYTGAHRRVFISGPSRLLSLARGLLGTSSSPHARLLASALHLDERAQDGHVHELLALKLHDELLQGCALARLGRKGKSLRSLGGEDHAVKGVFEQAMAVPSARTCGVGGPE